MPGSIPGGVQYHSPKTAPRRVKTVYLMAKYVKVLSASANGRIRRTTAQKPSTHSRIQQLLNELGIDREAWQFQAGIRLYSRMASHPELGIQSNFSS